MQQHNSTRVRRKRAVKVDYNDQPELTAEERAEVYREAREELRRFPATEDGLITYLFLHTRVRGKRDVVEVLEILQHMMANFSDLAKAA